MTNLGTLNRFVKSEDPWFAGIQFARIRNWENQESFYARAVLVSRGISLPHDAHGAGYDPCQSLAIEKAITEGIERWAFFWASQTCPELLGLHLDPSTTGLAALPTELGEHRVRAIAYAEALERWAHFEWIKGDLPLTSIQLDHPMHSNEQAFGAKIIGENGEDFHFSLSSIELTNGFAWGTAADKDPSVSLRRARSELWNNDRKVRRILTSKESLGAQPNEQTLFRFATNPSLKNQFLTLIHRGLTLPPRTLHAPPPQFAKNLAGDFYPEILVYRVVLADTRSIASAKQNEPVI